MMSAQPGIDANVLVIGGGPVGMGLAIELGQRGVDVLVVEKYHQPQQVPKGQNLTQRTMEHFHFWGIEDELRAARTIPPEYGIGGLWETTITTGFSANWCARIISPTMSDFLNMRLKRCFASAPGNCPRSRHYLDGPAPR